VDQQDQQSQLTFDFYQIGKHKPRKTKAKKNEPRFMGQRHYSIIFRPVQRKNDSKFFQTSCSFHLAKQKPHSTAISSLSKRIQIHQISWFSCLKNTVEQGFHLDFVMKANQGVFFQDVCLSLGFVFFIVIFMLISIAFQA
jgi:hypothetical protein